MLVTLTLLVPLVVSVLLLAMRPDAGAAAALARTGAAVTFLLAVAVCATHAQVDVPWVRSLGIRWSFGVDGLSLALVLLTALVGLLVVVTATSRGAHVAGSRSTFLGCLMLVELGALATFLARDALLFLIAFEVVLVPMWVLIRRYGDPGQAADAAARFVLFTAFGSALLLTGLVLLVVTTGTSDLRVLAAAHGSGLSPATQTGIAALLLLGLAVKVPLFGLHTWLPAAHTAAPTEGSVLLAAVLLKLGTYGMVRLVVPVVPAGLERLAPALALVGAVGVIWAGLLCLVERDIKRLIAYSSIAHMGFIAIGIGSGSQTGLQAAIFANVAHGLVSALLFFVVGDLRHRWGTGDLTVPRPGLRDLEPRRGLALLIGLAASLGLPGLVGFWGEFLALYSAWNPAPGRPVGVLRLATVLGAVGLALAAAYALRVARLVWAGESVASGAAGGSVATEEKAGGAAAAAGEGASAHDDARGAGLAVLVVLGGLVVLLGVWPHAVLAWSADDVAAVLSGWVAR